MELNFVQSSEVFGKNTLAWETEFKIMGDFNLHIERKKGGDILLYQRTSGSGYAIVEEFRGMEGKPAIDFDIVCLVPKFVKIVSESKPTYATVTTDGEITEIKSQSKEIEVTSNGTTEVTPDAGFAYLNSVKVKTNVAGSGEGGGRPKRVYITKEAFQEAVLQLEGTEQGEFGMVIMLYVDIIKYFISKPSIVGGAAFSMVEEQVTAMGINLEMETGGNDSFLKFEEAIQSTSQNIISAFEAMPKITEEEFYTL